MIICRHTGYNPSELISTIQILDVCENRKSWIVTKYLALNSEWKVQRCKLDLRPDLNKIKPL